MIEGLDEADRERAPEDLRATPTEHEGLGSLWFDSSGRLVSAVHR
jgi:hypothetical protein